MSDPLPYPVQLSQLRLRSITAGLEDLSAIRASFAGQEDGSPVVHLERIYPSDGPRINKRGILLPMAHLLALARLENDHPERAPVSPTPLHVPSFGGKTFDPNRDEVRLSEQLEVVAEALGNGDWWTISELHERVEARGFRVTPAGISARIRDLRKPERGGRTVERKRVEGVPGLHRYRLLPAAS